VELVLAFRSQSAIHTWSGIAIRLPVATRALSSIRMPDAALE
jgi:hypothetical protein